MCWGLSGLGVLHFFSRIALRGQLEGLGARGA